MLHYANLSFIFLQHSETFDISHVFLSLTIAELSTLKQVRFLTYPVLNKTEKFEQKFSHRSEL